MEPTPPEIQGTLNAMNRSADERAKFGPSNHAKRAAWDRADRSQLMAFFPKRLYFLLWLGTLCGLWFACLAPTLRESIASKSRGSGGVIFIGLISAGIFGYTVINLCSSAGRQWLFSRASQKLVFEDLKIVVRERDLSSRKVMAFAVFGLPAFAVIAALVIWFG